VTAVDTTTTILAPPVHRDGTPLVYVESYAGAEWVHPDDLVDDTSITYRATSYVLANPMEFPRAAVEGVTPRAQHARLVAQVQELEAKVFALQEALVEQRKAWAALIGVPVTPWELRRQRRDRDGDW
jgi:hypothetical protein